MTTAVATHAVSNAVANVLPKQDILVDFEDGERKELKTMRAWCIGCGIASIVSAITAWSVYFTPWIGMFVTVPTLYVAHMRMQTVKSLLQGETCWCKLCGPNPRDTLKACRPTLIVSVVIAVISVITQIAFLAEYGKTNDMSGAVGAVSVICLLVLIGLCLAIAYVAYRFRKVIEIFDGVTARQHLKHTELGGMAAVRNAASNAANTVTGFFRGNKNDAQQQQQQQPVQYNQQQPQQQYGQQQQQYGQQQQPQGTYAV